MQRTDLMDTTEAAGRMLLERLRSLTPEQRLRMTFDRIEAGRELRRVTEHLRSWSWPASRFAIEVIRHGI